MKDEIEGFLGKLGPRMRVWKRRWFKLSGGCLYYYKAKGDEKTAQWLGYFPLENLAVRQLNDLQFELFIPMQIGKDFPLRNHFHLTSNSQYMDG